MAQYHGIAFGIACTRIVTKQKAVVRVDEYQTILDACRAECRPLEHRPPTVAGPQMRVLERSVDREPSQGARDERVLPPRLDEPTRTEDMLERNHVDEKPSPAARIAAVEVERHIGEHDS